jgi:hypothetical protein
MGLTIHHELRLPRDTPHEKVADLVRQLQAAAARLPFEQVSPVVRTYADGSTEFDKSQPLTAFFMFSASLQLHARDPITDDWDRDDLPDGYGFGVNPGDGCETIAFGVAWLQRRDEEFRLIPNEAPTWLWSSHCKTQYASNISVEHFVRCHTSIVAVLDEAVRLGFDVRVSDEGEYWETRDVAKLTAKVDDMNHLVAKLAGALYDKLGPHVGLEAPIFDHPNFEHLEMNE